ncbi:norbelladine synthase-like [Triticum dicoccoides]|nr:norbelladine synthase-like [Triticum dicoccoides]XP_044325953.1 norbelladine synthase-like [Triticum aestivum]
MKGSLCHDFETGLPAAEVWEMYRGLGISQVVPQLLPDIFKKAKLVEGDGGVGTVLHLTFSHGVAPLEYQKEKFIKIDHENYVKEAIIVEGGLLDHGFQKYLMRIEIIGQTNKTSTIRSTIEYEVDDDKSGNTSFVSTSALACLAEAITEYIKAQKSAEQAREEMP